MDLFDKKNMKNMPYIYKAINIWWQKYQSYYGRNHHLNNMKVTVGNNRTVVELLPN